MLKQRPARRIQHGATRRYQNVTVRAVCPQSDHWAILVNGICAGCRQAQTSADSGNSEVIDLRERLQ